MITIPDHQGEMPNNYNSALGAKITFHKTHNLRFAVNAEYHFTSTVLQKGYFQRRVFMPTENFALVVTL